MLSEEKKGTRYLCVETEGWDTLNFTYTTGSTPKEAWLKTVSKEDLEDEPDKKKAKVKKIKMLDGEVPDGWFDPPLRFFNMPVKECWHVQDQTTESIIFLINIDDLIA